MDSLEKSHERVVFSEFEILAQKRSKGRCWVLANHPAVHRGGVSRRGFVAVAVAVSDM